MTDPGEVLVLQDLLLLRDQRAAFDDSMQVSTTKLWEAHEHLSQAQHLSRTGSFTNEVGSDRHVWSEELYRILEYDLSEKPSFRGFHKLIHDEDVARFDESFWRSMSNQSDLDVNFRIITSGNKLKHLHAVARVVLDSAGRPTVIGSIQDVTETKMSEAFLAAREAELRDAYAQLAEGQRLSRTGSFTSDIRSDAHSWSEEFYRIFEIDPEASPALTLVRERVHPDDLDLFDREIQAGMDGKGSEFTFRVIGPSGRLKYIRGLAQLVDDIEGRPIFIGTVQDITEAKLAEDALNEARAELAHVARVATLNTLTASIAHEVNQPLSGILVNASTCLRMLSGERPDVAGAADTARRTIRDANRATEVIARLRGLFAKKGVTAGPVDINDAAREVLALSATEYSRRQVQIETQLGELLPSVLGDRVQVQQVIFNLLLNAADAIVKRGDGPRSVKLETRLRGDSEVLLSVADTGVGLPRDAESLFKPFVTTKSGGMGLGLSISRSIVESFNGTLWAEPNASGGATFVFSLPVFVE